MQKTPIHTALWQPTRAQRRGGRSCWPPRGHLATVAVSLLLSALQATSAWAATNTVPHVKTSQQAAAAELPIRPTLRTPAPERHDSNAGRPAQQIDFGVILCSARATFHKTTPLAQAMDDLGFKPITQVKTNIHPSPGNLPHDFATERLAGDNIIAPGHGTAEEQVEQVFFWQSPAFCHRPLYFEQPNLERYGYSHGIWQPALSAAHFFTTVPILPYKMVVERPRECICTWDEHRPGDRSPWRWPLPRWDRRAAWAEGAAITGLIILIP